MIASRQFAWTWGALALASSLFGPGTARAESGPLNVHLDVGAGAPVAGEARDRDGDGQSAAGGAVWATLDYQLAPPFALELFGGGGGFATPFQTSSVTAAPYGTLGLGGRLRFLDDESGYLGEPGGKLGGNLWVSAHAGFVYFDERQFGLDAGVGYELSVVRPLSLGLFARTVVALGGRNDGADAFVVVGLSAGLAVERRQARLDSDGDGLTDEEERELGTDPGLRDTDRDRLPDGLEHETGTDPLSADTDSDGLLDGREDKNRDGVVAGGETDPREADTDGDGIRDSEERRAVGASPSDSDGDGVPNAIDQCADTPRGARVGADGCPAIAEDTPLPGVRFEPGRSRLSEGAEGGLQMALRFLRARPDATYEVAAYMEDTGDPAREARLTQSRAEVVVNWLARHGIPRDRLVPRGYGAADPVAPSDTPEGRARNERVLLRRAP